MHWHTHNKKGLRHT